MSEQTNLFGAIIFWLYILLALLFTYLVLDSIIKLPNPASHKHVATFSVLALIGFSTLSFNMLHVLVDSYRTWSERQVNPLAISLSSIWKWSITSTLFRDFGEAIVLDDARFMWTQSALMATMSISFFMGAQGLRQDIPRLWAFFALSQILPISFAHNLFYIALLRSPETKDRTIVLSRTPVLLVMLAYCACLSVAPYTGEGPYLMPTILVARLLLFAPVFLPTVLGHHQNWNLVRSGRSFTHWQAQTAIALLGAAMTIKQVFIMAIYGFSWREVLVALFSHPAVTSLGFDFIVTITSFSIWVLTQSYSPKRPIPRTKKTA